MAGCAVIAGHGMLLHDASHTTSSSSSSIMDAATAGNVVVADWHHRICLTLLVALPLP